MKENEIIKNNAIQYINSVVTTINSKMNIAIPEQHPKLKMILRITSNLSTSYSSIYPSHCICINQSKQQICRFRYPKEYHDS